MPFFQKMRLHLFWKDKPKKRTVTFMVAVFVFYFEFDLNLSLRVMSPRANNLLCFRPPTVWDAGRKQRGGGRQRRGQCTDARANVGYRNPKGCWFKSGSRNQQCEPKKISVQKTQKPQRLLGFFRAIFQSLN